MTVHSGPQPVFSRCLHRHIRVIHHGGMSFSEGEVCDDIQEYVLCLDCFETLSEADIRATWNGYSQYAITLEQQDETQ